MRNFLELLGDAYIVFLGCLLIYIFLTIEVFGRYGVEANSIVRRIELFMGIPVIVLGVLHFIKDIKEMKK